LECGGLPPLSERSRQALQQSGSKLSHSKAALRAAEQAAPARARKSRRRLRNASSVVILAAIAAVPRVYDLAP
jgi:ferric-dicitrate binding protein FerR (iron transport regulator)